MFCTVYQRHKNTQNQTNSLRPFEDSDTVRRKPSLAHRITFLSEEDTLRVHEWNFTETENPSGHVRTPVAPILL